MQRRDALRIGRQNFSNGLLLAITCYIALIGGCAKTERGGTVTGSITYKGKQLTEGTVLFTQVGGATASGRIDPQGQFKLQTNLKSEFVPPGEYLVVVIAGTGSMAQLSEDPQMLKGIEPAVPLEFTSPATTPLKFEVKEGLNAYEVVLEEHRRPARGAVAK